MYDKRLTSNINGNLHSILLYFFTYTKTLPDSLFHWPFYNDLLTLAFVAMTHSVQSSVDVYDLEKVFNSKETFSKSNLLVFMNVLVVIVCVTIVVVSFAINNDWH